MIHQNSSRKLGNLVHTSVPRTQAMKASAFAHSKLTFWETKSCSSCGAATINA